MSLWRDRTRTRPATKPYPQQHTGTQSSQIARFWRSFPVVHRENGKSHESSRNPADRHITNPVCIAHHSVCQYAMCARAMIYARASTAWKVYGCDVATSYPFTIQ